MLRLVVRAFVFLVRIDFLTWRRGFPAVHELLKRAACPNSGKSQFRPEQVCRAVDLACVFYFKAVLCLQRSTATTLLLRSDNVPAQLVIGAQTLPFKSHAWVEVERRVVNDKPYIQELYRELERC